MLQNANESQKGDIFKKRLYEKISQQINTYLEEGVKMLDNIDLSTVNPNIIDIVHQPNERLHKLMYNSMMCPNSCGILVSNVQNLSKNGRIVLSRSIDIIESIDIGCFSPEQIESVILYCAIQLPSDLNTIDLESFNYKSYVTYKDNSYSDVHYIPLKTYTKSSHIKIPLNLVYSNLTHLSIEVKFNMQNTNLEKQCLKSGIFSVKVNGIIVDTPYSKKIRDNTINNFKF